MKYQIKEEGEFKYIDEGKGEIFLLLHGLFGALSNWEGVLDEFSTRYRVLIPMMPIYQMPVKTAGLDVLTDFIEKFVDYFALKDLTLLGNSLGGHLALMYTLRQKSNVKKLVLTGSSGLFESAIGGSYPKRGSYEYIKERVEYTFYKPETASKELIDEVFEITSSIPKCLNIVAIAKSAQRNNMAAELPGILAPTLLVWGLNDTITPVSVAYEFNALIPNSTLRFIDHCSHAPMMEHPQKFNALLNQFLEKNTKITPDPKLIPV